MQSVVNHIPVELFILLGTRIELVTYPCDLCLTWNSYMIVNFLNFQNKIIFAVSKIVITILDQNK